MSSSRAVIIPFGVPEDGRGLGLGLAALVHGSAQIAGYGVGLAQVHARKPENASSPAPVEAFVPPHTWRDLAGAGNAPAEVNVVVTGALEPPGESARGLIQVLVFDAQSGATRARVEQPIDNARAGAGVVAAFEDAWREVGGEMGLFAEVRDLDWDALESVLRAERCALHDPSRGGPHDRLAALLHLGRAIGDAPAARYPVGRLAQVALETAMSTPHDPKLAQAAMRALDRASADTAGGAAQLDLAEATAALEIRAGRPRDAERRLNAAIAAAPQRGRLYVLLAQALRARGDREGALTALQLGSEATPRDPLLACERGVVLAESGDLAAAAASWRAALTLEPLHPIAFGNLAGLALAKTDGALAQSLVDAVLASERAHPDVLRRTIQLLLASEQEGLARAARVARVARMLVDRAPDDAGGQLSLARALATLGERDAALSHAAMVESLAPSSAAAAEAQRTRFALEEPEVAAAIDATLRMAVHATVLELNPVAERARTLATAHRTWMALLASAIAERRLGRAADAKVAAEGAIALAPGCAPAHAEMVGALLALNDAARAVVHAERAIALEGESPRGLALLARTLHAASRQPEARAVIARARAMAPNDEAVAKVDAEVRTPTPKPPTPSFIDGLLGKVRGIFGGPTP